MDIRAQRSKNEIRKALLSCMRNKPWKDISVTEVCESAGLNRTTFYKYYKEVEDILREIEQEQLDDFRELLETRDIFGEELINDVLDQIEKTKEINKTVKTSYFSENYIEEMASIAKDYALDSWQKRMPKATGQEVELALTSMISAALQVVKRADRYDRETIVKYINNMINGVVKMYE